MSPRFVLVAGPPGTGVRCALAKISRQLRKNGLRVCVVDVERVIEDIVNRRIRNARRCRDSNQPISEPLSAYLLDILNNPSSIAAITWHLPRDLVTQLWEEAVDIGLTRLASRRADVRILKTHLNFYRGETYEFYSPIAHDLRAHCTKILDQGLDDVIVFIDDIYDMYVRLSRPGQAFDFQRQLEAEHKRISDEEKGQPRKSKSLLDSPHERFRLSLSLVVRTLLRLLTWREKEILAADALAGTARKVPIVIAVKHPINLGAAFVTGRHAHDALPVYLSHPISRPRKKQQADGAWPAFVDEFHNFIRALMSLTQPRAFLPIMPTAIDEYRIKSITIGRRRGVLVPELAPRWPLACDKDNLMYALPRQHVQYEDYESAEIARVFDPPIYSSLDDQEKRPYSAVHPEGWKALPRPVLHEITGMLHTLTMQMLLQMANRDHLLVRQCPGFLLYRPWAYDARFSRGVAAEILNWRRIVEVGDSLRVRCDRPILFIHETKDVRSYKPPVTVELRAKAQAIIVRLTGYRIDMRNVDVRQRKWVNTLLAEETDYLDGGNISPDARAAIESNALDIESEMAREVQAAVVQHITNFAASVPGARCRIYPLEGAEAASELSPENGDRFWANVAQEATNFWFA